MSASDASTNIYAGIDSGYVNFQKCASILSSELFAKWVTKKTSDKDQMSKLMNARLMTELVLTQCHINKVRSLQEVLLSPQIGEMFTGVPKLSGRGVVGEQFESKLVSVLDEGSKTAVLRYRKEHFFSDTHWIEIGNSSYDLAVVGQVRTIDENMIVLYPLLMGWETFNYDANSNAGYPKSFLDSLSFRDFEISVGQIAQFEKCSTIRNAPPAIWMPYMKSIPELAVKQKFCELLDIDPQKDWGGEECDVYGSVTLGALDFRAAFLLKGPAGGRLFRAMLVKDLGKNSDQISRLAGTDAQILIVQHCHEISPAVHKTLKAFALQLPYPKLYCAIDGRTTYKILKAYGKL
jgi:hypothetical protein